MVPSMNQKPAVKTAGSTLRQFLPGLASRLPWVALGELPTPLEECPDLAAELGIGRLWIKRDDLTSPLYGGNKVRKLEHLLADARDRGCDTVVTFGTTGSNHALATSIFAQQLGLHCHAVLMAQPITPYLEPTLRYHLHVGTELHLANGYEDSLRVAERIRNSHPRGAERVYEISWGGSSWLGTTGFVGAGIELVRQFEANARPLPDFIYLAGGSMGTALGLALGLRLMGCASRIVIARVVPGGPASAERLVAMMRATNSELHALDPDIPLLDDPMAGIELRGEFFGTGYACATPEAEAAVALFSRFAELRLETTYTGKAVAALVADARAGRLVNRQAVFWNTYSSASKPAALADVDLDALPGAMREQLRAG